MTQPQFTDQQLRDFKAFRRIQETGQHNMFSPRVRVILGISKDEHLYIIENYEALEAAVEAKEAS